VKRNRGDVVNALTLHRFLIQALNVAERVRKAQPGHLNFAGRQSIKHEGIVRVWTVGDADFADIYGSAGQIVSPDLKKCGIVF
jgi:hypothetical protein